MVVTTFLGDSVAASHAGKAARPGSRPEFKGERNNLQLGFATSCLALGSLLDTAMGIFLGCCFEQT